MALENHGNLLERCVASALANAVDSNLCLAGTIDNTSHTAEGVGCSHTEVVVAVGGDDGVLDAIDMIHEVLDFGTIVLRQAVASGVGDVNHGGTCFNYSLHHAGQILVVRTACILGIELNIVHKTASILHGFDGTLNDLLAV